MGNKISHAAQRLRDESIPFDAIKHGSQLVVDPNGLAISFWPISGKFYPRNKDNPKPTTHLNGVEDLIKYIREV